MCKLAEGNTPFEGMCFKCRGASDERDQVDFDESATG
jgi:hypothetical protein